MNNYDGEPGYDAMMYYGNPNAQSNFRMGEIGANPGVNNAFNSFGGGGHWSAPAMEGLGSLWQGAKNVDWLGSTNTQTGVRTPGALGTLGSLGLGAVNAFVGYGQLKNSKAQLALAEKSTRANVNGNIANYDRQIEEKYSNTLAQRSANDAAAGTSTGRPMDSLEQYMANNGMSKYKMG